MHWSFAGFYVLDSIVICVSFTFAYSEVRRRFGLVESLRNRLPCFYARINSVMQAFDFEHIYKAGTVTEYQHIPFTDSAASSSAEVNIGTVSSTFPTI